MCTSLAPLLGFAITITNRPIPKTPSPGKSVLSCRHCFYDMYSSSDDCKWSRRVWRTVPSCTSLLQRCRTRFGEEYCISSRTAWITSAIISFARCARSSSDASSSITPKVSVWISKLTVWLTRPLHGLWAIHGALWDDCQLSAIRQRRTCAPVPSFGPGLAPAGIASEVYQFWGMYSWSCTWSSAWFCCWCGCGILFMQMTKLILFRICLGSELV